MRTGLAALPSNKQQALQTIVRSITQHYTVEMIILFGSYARGDWVEEYEPDGVHFQYQSDLDLLVLVATRSLTEQNRLEQKLEDSMEQLAIQTPVSILVHDVDYVNSQIEKAQYFFSDIKKEGILLYDSKRYQLEKVRKLSQKDRYHLAKEDFDYWFSNAKSYYRQ